MNWTAVRTRSAVHGGWRDVLRRGMLFTVVAVVAVVGGAFAVIQSVREASESARAAHSALTAIEKGTDELESLAWEAFALRRTPGRDRLARPRADITRELGVLQADSSHAGRLKSLRTKLDAYDRALRGEMKLVASERHAEARASHLLSTVPRYEDLDAYLGVFAPLEAANERSAARAADLGIATSLAVAALALIGVFAQMSRYRDGLARERERRLHEEAGQDALTGLPNRRALFGDLTDAAAGQPPSVLALVDLDGFKRYNDSFGHAAGDLLLRRIAAKLTAIADPGRAYRLGGDEFCVLAPAHHREALEEGLGALEESGDAFSVRASFGAVLLPDEAADATEALARADKLMYRQKFQRHSVRDAGAYSVARTFVSERFPEMAEQANAVAEQATSLGRELGLNDADINVLRRAATLRDVGKVAIPDTIVGKFDSLDDDESLFVRRHSAIGDRLLSACPTLAPLAGIVRATHERWDGSGYPDGLAGAQIPLASRIIFVCDAYNAMTSDRPYRRALPPPSALAEIVRGAGSQFDPDVADAFERLQRRQSQHRRAAVVAS